MKKFLSSKFSEYLNYSLTFGSKNEWFLILNIKFKCVSHLFFYKKHWTHLKGFKTFPTTLGDAHS